MALRIRTQNFAMFAASTAVVAGGVLLPTSAFAAPAAPPHTGTVTTTAATHGGQGHQAAADPAEGWVEISDPPSGIKFRMPANPTVENTTGTGPDGETITGRKYSAKTHDGTTNVYVYDIPGKPEYLDYGAREVSQAFKEAWGVTATSTSQKTTVDGHPARETHLSSNVRAGSDTIIAADDAHVIEFMSLGPAADEKATAEVHKQAVGSVQIATSEAPAPGASA
ncbi:hypothetical protein ACWGDT_36780 [Streptomyces avermitilis]